MKVLSGGCRVFGPGDGRISTVANCSARTVIDRASGAQWITQTIFDHGIGRSPAFVNPSADEVLYIARGEGVCYVNGFAYELRPGTGVFIPPGTECGIENPGPDRLRIVSSCCPQDLERRIVENPVAAASSEAPRRTVHEQDRDVIRAGKDREFRYLVHTDLGCREVTQFVGWIPPSKAPFHFHEYEEGTYILEGHGIVHAEGESCEFGPGSSIYFPKGLRHCVENPGASSIRLLGVFYPSGSPSAAYED